MGVGVMPIVGVVGVVAGDGEDVGVAVFGDVVYGDEIGEDSLLGIDEVGVGLTVEEAEGLLVGDVGVVEGLEEDGGRTPPCKRTIS